MRSRKEEAGPCVKVGSLWLPKRDEKGIVNVDKIIVEGMHSTRQHSMLSTHTQGNTEEKVGQRYTKYSDYIPYSDSFITTGKGCSYI